MSDRATTPHHANLARLSFLLMGTLLAGGAHATQVFFDFTGATAASATALWTASGYVELTDTDLAPSTNLAPLFDSWSFTWTDGTTTYSTDSTLEPLSAGSSFHVEADLTTVFYAATDVCSGTCSFTDHPEIRVESFRWIATLEGGESTFYGSASWSRRPPVGAAEPPTVAALAAGLMALGAVRRRIRSSRLDGRAGFAPTRGAPIAG